MRSEEFFLSLPQNKTQMKRLFLLQSILLLALSIAATDNAQYVNPFIGCAYNGHTFPGATRPFGMIQASPVTGAVGWQYCSEYVYGDSVLWGFSQTHLNGTGCTDLGDILVMPLSGKRHRQWDEYRSRINKATEQASPGYYSAYLPDAGAQTEITATPHAALYRFNYDRKDSVGLLIDLQHGPAWNNEQYHSHVKLCEVYWEDKHTLVGHVRNAVWVWQDYFFVMEFSQPVADTLRLEQGSGERGWRLVAGFNLAPEKQLLMRVALSTVSISGARRNLREEISDWNFERVRKEARSDWNSYLDRIEVDGSDAEKQMFYTALYHLLIQPNQIADKDGLYRDATDSIRQASGGVFYSTFSLWDTYRAAHPLYTLLVPEKVPDFVNSLLDQAEVQGFLPIWGLWGRETWCMIGNHGVSVIAEALLKGFKGFDVERAWQAVLQTQTRSHGSKSRWDIYDTYGYFPTDLVDAESVSTTLESVYDDYAALLIAQCLGKTEAQPLFLNRINYYKNLFDSETGFLRPRKADGSWLTPFNPAAVGHAESSGGDYTEGNAWQYTWHVQHDPQGLISLYGGREQFLQKLDSFFVVPLETSLSDVTGLIGQYAHGNEPSHHVAYLYALAGRPERTQELVRQIVTTQYLPQPDGLCGNDDCGQMSAWYIFSALGFYPVSPVDCEYVFGAPQLPQISLQLPNGKQLTILADNLSEQNLYVKSISLNGRPITTPTISHSTLLEGGTLRFEMAARP